VGLARLPIFFTIVSRLRTSFGLASAKILSPAGVDEIPPTAGTIISTFTGVYERIARKLNVSASLVSKVASGSRKSVDIDAELAAELKTLKEKLARYG
jgi:transcriptional regulator with XRE-family HTH domain